MECKNCELPLRTDYSFCANCGARIIRNRITLKNLWHDITERYFNLDNTFLKTFWHLSTKPEVVIEGYINGVRKKYLNPISYLGIALTFSGLFIFLLRKFFIHKFDFDSITVSTMDSEATKKIIQISLDFSSLVFIMYIPIIALAGWLVFNHKKYILPEYIVVATYCTAHYSIFIFPFSLLLVIITPESYLTLSTPMIFIMVLYTTYAINRFDKKSFGKSFLFLLLFTIGFFGLSIMLNIIFLLTGAMSIEDYIPKH